MTSEELPSLQEVVLRHGDAYLQKYGSRLLPSHRRVLHAIGACRTEAMGGHVFRCAHCHSEVYHYHSCKNRHCPRCHRDQTEEWTQSRSQELLPVPYYHVVFTVPQELHGLIRRNQKLAYAALMRCAGKALLKLCMDPKYVGAQVGVMAVLHTWTRSMGYHPHVHCLVTGGGLDAKANEWRESKRSFLVPVKALSKMYRGMLQQELAPLLEQEPALHRAFARRKWVAYIQPAVNQRMVLAYLARYVHRVAISDRNILKITDTHVTWRYQDNATRQWHVMRLPAEQFLHRFLQHSLPQGFKKVRYFGLWHSSKKMNRLKLTFHLPPPRDHPLPEKPADNEAASQKPACHLCQKGPLVWTGRVLRRRKPP